MDRCVVQSFDRKDLGPQGGTSRCEEGCAMCVGGGVVWASAWCSLMEGTGPVRVPTLQVLFVGLVSRSTSYLCVCGMGGGRAAGSGGVRACIQRMLCGADQERVRGNFGEGLKRGW